MNISSEADLARVINCGIRLTVLPYGARAGFSKQEIEHFVIPARTLRHCKTKREPLSIEESDRVVRLTRVQSLAEDVFGDIGKANRRLREGLGALDDKSLLAIARTESGARLIEQILTKIDWGTARLNAALAVDGSIWQRRHCCLCHRSLCRSSSLLDAILEAQPHLVFNQFPDMVDQPDELGRPLSSRSRGRGRSINTSSRTEPGLARNTITRSDRNTASSI